MTCHIHKSKISLMKITLFVGCLIWNTPVILGLECPTGWYAVSSTAECIPCAENWYLNGTTCESCPPTQGSIRASTSCTGTDAKLLQAGRGKLTAEVQKIQPSRVSGWSVAVNGGNKIAFGAKEMLNNTGVVFIYERNQSNIWTETVQLRPEMGKEEPSFGTSVSMSDDILVIGARRSNGDMGSVYIYNTTYWSQIQKIHADDGAAGDYFGCSIAVDGNIMAIGAYLNNGTGSAYIFEKSSTKWIQVAKLRDLTAEDGAYYGFDVAVSSNRVAVSAPNDRGTRGIAHVYERLYNGTYHPVAQLMASDGTSGDYFGQSVSVSGDNVVVGAYQSDKLGIDSGSAYVYQLEGSVWKEKQILVATDFSTETISLSGNFFGWSVYINGDMLLVSAPFDREQGLWSGAVYTYQHDRVARSWRPGSKLLASDGGPDDYFGYSVGVSQATVAIIRSGDVSGQGALYVFGCACGTHAGIGSHCVGCPPFSFSTAVGSTSPSTCQPCSNHTSTLLVPALCYCECQAGTYLITNRTACAKCPSGSYSNVTGAVSSGVCQSCQSGYVALAGSKQCQLCGAGEYSSIDHSECLQCPAGTNSSIVGAVDKSVCQPCLPGYASTAGSASCRQCTIGSVAPHTGSPHCDVCPLDTYWVNTTFTCQKCAVGTYSNPGSVECTRVSDTERLSPGCITSKLTPQPGAVGDLFGSYVSVSGNLALIGASGDSTRGAGAGAAYIYERINGVWAMSQKIQCIDAIQYQSFGVSVALERDIAVVGAIGDSLRGFYAGAVYLFQKEGTKWIQKQKITASDGTAYAFYGKDVALSDDSLVVGAYLHGNGAAYLYSPTSSGSWVETGKLDGLNPGSFFGYAVAVSGDTIVIGAYGEERAYIYQSMNQTAVLNVTGTEYFGHSVAVDGSVAVVGAYGSNTAYVYEYQDNVWTLRQTLTPVDGTLGEFGYSVAVLGSSLFVGRSDGPVSLFLKNGETWEFKRILSSPEVGTGDFFGRYISVSGSTVFISAYGLNQATGAVYVGSCCPGAQTLGVACRTCDAGSVSLSIGATRCTKCDAGTSSPRASTQCHSCGYGHFSVYGGVCQACLKGFYCPSLTNAAQIMCPPGHHNLYTKQTTCYACPKPERCIGGANCSVGYDGILCGRCSLDYFVKGDKCLKCPPVPVFLIIAMAVAFLFLVMFLTLRIPPAAVTQLKQLVTFVQCLSITLSIGIPWPPLVEWLQSLLASFTMDVIDLASPECLVGGGVNWHIRFWLSLALSGTVPLVILIAVTVVSLLRKYLEKRAKPSRWKLYLSLTVTQIRLSRLLFLLISVIYVPLTKNAVKAFDCVSSPHGVVLADDTSINCSDVAHQIVQTVAVLVLVLVSGLLPVIVGGSGIVGRRADVHAYRRLDSYDTLGAVFESYHPAHAYFEGIVMLRKAFMTIVVTSLATTARDVSSVSGQWASFTQSLLLSMISGIYVVVLLFIRPFAPVPIPPPTSLKSHRLTRQREPELSHKQTRRLTRLVDMLNHIEIASASSIFLNSLVAFAMWFIPSTSLTDTINLIVSIIVGLTGFATVVAMILPFVFKRVHGQTVMDPDGDYKKNPGDPRCLLGLADGRWLLALERQLDDIVDVFSNLSPELRVELAGAAKVWIDRLSGRLRKREEKLAVFHPDLHVTKRSYSVRLPSGSDVIELESLKFRKGRREAVKMMREMNSRL